MRIRLVRFGRTSMVAWMWVACGFGAPELHPVDVISAMTSPTQFPISQIDGTIFGALDSDPSTTWRVEPGEVGTFVLTDPPAALVLDADVTRVWVRAHNANPDEPDWDITEWREYPVGPKAAVQLGIPDVAARYLPFIEVKFASTATVGHVSFLAEHPSRQRAMPHWQFSGCMNGQQQVIDESALVVGEADPERCWIAPDSQPDYSRFRGTCRRQGQDLVVDGTMQAKPISGVIKVRPLSRCLALVDGWPMARCEIAFHPSVMPAPTR